MTETEVTSSEAKRPKGAVIVLSASLLLGLALVLARLLTSGSPRVTGVCIDASRPVRVSMPLQVVAIGDNGERGLWLGPQLGEKDGDQSNGRAEYRFYVPQTGDYTLWMYCLWHGEGHNTVLVGVDSQGVFELGGDTTADTWHWEKGPKLRLAEGMHGMDILAPNDNIALRKMFIINVDDVGPEECGVVLSEIFHEDFDGCNDGNFALWEQCGGQWKVMHPEWEERPDGKTLLGNSRDTAMILMHGSDWRRYTFSLSSRTLLSAGSASAVGMCFGVQNEKEYHLLLWREDSGKNEAEMHVLRMTATDQQIIASFDVPWKSGDWHDVEVELKAEGIAISVDHRKKRIIACQREITGGIGLWMTGQSEAEFDNIEVKPSWSLPGDLPLGATESTQGGQRNDAARLKGVGAALGAELHASSASE